MTSDDAHIWHLHHGEGLSIRAVAKRLGLNRGKVYRALTRHAAAAEDDDEGGVALLDAERGYLAVRPFTFVGIESVVATQPGDDIAEARDMERFLDGNGYWCSMLDIWRADFADGSEGHGYLVDAQPQFEQAGYRRVSTGDGYWHWERD